MGFPTQPAALGVLRRRWKQWNAVVELFVTRRVGRRGVDPREYKALYCNLLRACRNLEAEVAGADRELCRQLQDIVRPWINLQAFGRADKLVLHSVLNDCQSVGRKLGIRQWPGWFLRWTFLAVVFLALTSGVVLTGIALQESLWEWWQKCLRWIASLRAFHASLSDGQKIVLVGLVVMGLAMLLVSRTRGSG